MNHIARLLPIVWMTAFLSLSTASVQAQVRQESFSDYTQSHASSKTVRLSDEQPTPATSIKLTDTPDSNSLTPALPENSKRTTPSPAAIPSVRLSDNEIPAKDNRLKPIKAASEPATAATPSNPDQFLIRPPASIPSVTSQASEKSKATNLLKNFSSKPQAVTSPDRFPISPLKSIPQESEPTIEKSEIGKSTVNTQGTPQTFSQVGFKYNFASQDDDKESTLLKSFPVADLHAGIRVQSFHRATTKRVIDDPNYQFLKSAHQAPLYDHNDYVLWKTWESPNVRYRPLWFEEENLERYGQHSGHCLQPYVSGVHFFGGVMMLPYKFASEGMSDCEYGMGYYRPGNCNPAYRKRIQCSGRGLILQTLTIGGIMAL